MGVPQLNSQKGYAVPESCSNPFPKQIAFALVAVYSIGWSNRGTPAGRDRGARRANSNQEHGTHFDPCEEYFKAIRELAIGSTVVVAACPKSPRSSVCRVQPSEWLVDAGPGHDLVDLALVMRCAHLISEPDLVHRKR